MISIVCIILRGTLTALILEIPSGMFRYPKVRQATWWKGGAGKCTRTATCEMSDTIRKDIQGHFHADAASCDSIVEIALGQTIRPEIFYIFFLYSAERD